jgi:hypothetical protein
MTGIGKASRANALWERGGMRRREVEEGLAESVAVESVK